MELNPNLSDKAQQDYALVEAALRGEEKAFARLLSNVITSYSIHYTKLYDHPSSLPQKVNAII